MASADKGRMQEGMPGHQRDALSLTRDEISTVWSRNAGQKFQTGPESINSSTRKNRERDEYSQQGSSKQKSRKMSFLEVLR